MKRVPLVRTLKPSVPTKPRMKFSHTLLGRLRHGATRRSAEDKAPQIDPFKLPEFPKTVAPESSRMAMDEALVANVAFAQAQYNGASWNGIGFLGYTYLAELAQRPEYRTISEVIATEMTRKWIRLRAEGDEDKTEQIKELNAELERLNVREIFGGLCVLDGFFGRAHLYLDTGDTDNPDELKLPIGNGYDKMSKLKMKKGKLKAIRSVEPVWTYPTSYNSNDPLSGDWYNPQSWFVQGKEIHSSRLFTFVGRPVPDMLKPSYSFGGLAMSQMAMPYINNWLKTRQSVSDLISNFSVSGIRTNLGATLTPEGDDLLNRVDFFNLMRDNRGLMVLDKDTEEFFNITTPLSGLDLLQAQSQEHMAAVSRIPIVKLLGIQPAGLNASSEGEIRTFYDWINAYQRYFFGLKLKRIIAFAQLNIWGAVDPTITFEFEPLWSLDELQQATVKKTKADTGAVLIGSGAIDASEERKRVAGDPETDYAGLDVNALPEPPDDGSDDEGDQEQDDDTSDEGGSADPVKKPDSHQAEKLKPTKAKPPKVGGDTQPRMSLNRVALKRAA